MGSWTKGPWKLIRHGNETYPFPLSVHSEDDAFWIARDGTVSSEANAHLITAAPDLYEACQEAWEQVALMAKDPTTNWLVKQLGAALAKARGETDA